MSLLLFLIWLLLSPTDSLYHVLTDSSGTTSYMAQISAISTGSFNLIIYTQLQSPYTSSPICSDCIIFNGTLKTPNVPINRNALALYIKSNPILQTHNIYLFLECPLLSTISIALPSHHIQYIQHTPTFSNHSNTDEFQCVFQQQTNELSNTIHYVLYHKPNHIQSFEYYIPLKLHQIKQYIHTPFNTSITPHILYYNDIIYFVFLSPNKHNHITLHIASYNLIDKTWYRNDDTLTESNILFDPRRRLLETDPECQDVSANCAHIINDCDDEGIANICRASCGECDETPFNCSDYKSSANTVDICQFPRETASFCADPDGWFLYFCPITCHHPNCSKYWSTTNPTITPTITTTTVDFTKVTDITLRQSTDITLSTIMYKDNDMTLILILLGVLLMCILMASVLLWICVNIVRLQRDRNYMAYNSIAAMSSRTPDFYTHPGVAPSTPDYYRTELHSHHVHSHRGSFQRG